MEYIQTYPTTRLDIDQNEDLIDDATREITDIVFDVMLTGTISALGVIANIINVIVFLKQGMKDSVNISLLALAISDMFALMALVWMSAGLNPVFWPSDNTFEPNDLIYLTAGWPYLCFIRTTSWITVYITFERCLAIALPLKVKTILTYKRTIFTIITIFTVLIASVSPIFFAASIEPKFFPDRNKTLHGLVYVENGIQIENICYTIIMFAQLISCPLVFIFTVILIRNLLQKSKWRAEATNTSTSVSKDAKSSRRETRVVKMVTFISCIFIVCSMPSAITIIVMLVFTPDFSMIGVYQNTFLVTWSVLNTLAASNSAVNIFVYYNMSAKYKSVFDGMFRKRNKFNEKGY